MLGARIDLSQFIIFNSELRIKVSQTRYVYPDLSVVRGQGRYEFDNELTLLNPVLVVEGDIAKLAGARPHRQA